GNDEQRTDFVDQDGVDFIDDGKVVSTLHTIFQVELHVIAQVVESKFVVRAIRHIGSVSIAAFLVVEVVDNHTYRQSKETVELAHPLRVALCQIIVDRDYVNTTPT